MNAASAWFHEKGWKPFRYQRECWKAYLNGESGLIHAPTGYGKTYAAWLGPVCEFIGEVSSAQPLAQPRARKKRSDTESLRAVWITPLRALAGDTVKSLEQPVHDLNLPFSIELRTGDVSSFRRKKQREKLPTVLVTTPESLTLLLSYPEAKERFATIKSVIVDEWHELMGTKRGVQTELALARLRTWCPALRTWGLSATLGNLEEARDVLLGPTAAGRLISGPREKKIRLDTLIPDTIERFPWAGHLGDTLAADVVDAIDRARSTLLFTNTRSQAEIWHAKIRQLRPDWHNAIGLHHGSLQKTIRREVEVDMAAGRLKCVVCTASLDLGIDFSPVDQVLQLGSPKGIARLMQRAGRSGHQPGAESRILCVPTHSFELLEFAAARMGIRENAIESRAPCEKPLDVLAQHLVTVGAGGGFEPTTLIDEVRSTWAYRDLTDGEWEWCLDFVTRGGKALYAYPEYSRLSFDENGRLTTSAPSIDKVHRLNIGTITADSAMRVRMQRGRDLGTIEESFIARLEPGNVFAFAGKLLELKRVRDMTAYVANATSRRGIVPRWQGGRFPLSTHLGQMVRRTLARISRGERVPHEASTLKPLFMLQSRWSLIPSEQEVLIETTKTREGSHWFCFPFEGRLVNEGLAALIAFRMSRRKPSTIQLAANDYGFELLSTAPLNWDEASWQQLLSTDNLAADLLQCVNQSQMARRQFRDIARIAGLISQGLPGHRKAARHLQASSELFFDVFQDYDPENMLLGQARREVLEAQLEFSRLHDALRRICNQDLRLVETARLTPLAFPLWAERLRAQYVSTESWLQRVQRAAERLETTAGNSARIGKNGSAKSRSVAARTGLSE